MRLLSLLPALIFALVGLIAIVVLLRPIFLAIKPYIGLTPRKKRPHLYQVKIDRSTKSSEQERPDDIIIH